MESRSERDALLVRRLSLVAKVSGLTAEMQKHNQILAGLEMDLLRIELETGRDGSSEQLVRDLHEAEQAAQMAMAQRADCEERIKAAEKEVEAVDREIAASGALGGRPMNQQSMRNLTLFDLLARNWQCQSAVTGLAFSGDGLSVAFACADGTVAITAAEDREPPEKRVRVSGDLGQTTIRPREKPPVPLIVTAALGDATVPLTAQPRYGFLAGSAGSEVVPVSGAGDLGAPLFKAGGPVIALDRAAQAGIIAAGYENGVTLWRGTADARTFDLGKPLSALALSPDGRRLALGLDDELSIRPVQGSGAARNLPLPARAVSLQWSFDGAWLACGLENGGLALVSASDGSCSIVPDFAAPVRDVAWSTPAKALFASGAFRIAGWSDAALPLGGNSDGALETGHAGLVPIEAVAAHPAKPLVAAGSANGRIVIAKAGSRDELVVRPMGGAVTALAWSSDGRHLAASCADGTAAVATFPDQLFK
ncbi:WD40 repeat domain-containing protein [Mesorhizobium sp. CN2-181]|uniref:WD40 repeat domain-containing protein n=1 Tax=Mesorhizobium yinganensis TaxID=3157707 RepID=UPI0032B8560A